MVTQLTGRSVSSQKLEIVITVSLTQKKINKSLSLTDGVTKDKRFYIERMCLI